MIQWLDRVIDDICNHRDHLVLIQKEEPLSTRLAELQEVTERVERLLEEVRAEKSIKSLPPSTVNNDKIYIIAGN